MTTRIASHRGITKTHQENTLGSILAAQSLGVDMVEFDVQRSKDGVWFLHHDLYIGDETNKIKDLRFDTILELAEEEDIEISVFEEILCSVDHIELNIECKSQKYQDGQDLAKYLSDFDISQPFNISSFSRNTLRGLYDTDPDLRISYLGYLMPFFRWQRFNDDVPLYSINPYKAFLFRWKVNAAHERGIQVHAWTVNNEGDMIKCFENEIDVIITDKPELALRVRSEYN